MCAEILTGNTPQLNQPIRQHRPIIWNILEKSPRHISIIRPLLRFQRSKEQKYNHRGNLLTLESNFWDE